MHDWKKSGNPLAPQPRAVGKNEDDYDYYRMPTELLNQVQKRPQQPWHVETINIGTAGSKLIPAAGMGIVIFGHDNSATKVVDTTVFCELLLEENSQNVNPFPLKHNRGFIGPFTKVFLNWPAQKSGGTDRYMDVVIYHGFMRPWIDGGAAT